MKHNKVSRIWYSIIINGIFLVTLWGAWKSQIWYVTIGDYDFFVKLFAIIGMFSTLLGINYLIEYVTRTKDKVE